MHDGYESKSATKSAYVSIVIPLFNEEESVDQLIVELSSVLGQIPYSTELILVDDSSNDGTLSKLHAANEVFQFTIISFKKNSGHASAIWSGMKHATGDVIVTLDGDLQHPPSLIPVLINEFHKAKVEVVYAIRNDLLSERWSKRVTSHMFFLTIRYVFGLRLIPYANDFRLIKKSYFDAITTAKTRVEIMRALLASHDHSFHTVGFNLHARKVGVSKFTIRKMLNLYGQTVLYAPRKRSIGLMSIGAVTSGTFVFYLVDGSIHPILSASLSGIGFLLLCLSISVLSFKSCKKIYS